MSNYAIPGFQQPTHPKLDERVFADADGRVDFMFMDDRDLQEPLPAFVVYIDLERGREINLQAKTDTTRFIYEKIDECKNKKSYWFRLRTDELIILPGTYQVRFVVNGQEVAQKSLTVRNHPALPDDPFELRNLTPTCPD
jgi:hypothetical protein